MSLTRVTKKLLPRFSNVDACILMVNALDPQLSTVGLFYSAIEDKTFLTVLNKCDLVEKGKVAELKGKLKGEVITASLINDRGLQEIKYRLGQWNNGSRILVLGVFNSGKTTLINLLAGGDGLVDDLPGTTLEFKEYCYGNKTLVDSIGQVIDINLPLMVSLDFTQCYSIEEKLHYAITQDLIAITESIGSAMPDMLKAVNLIVDRVNEGGKLIICGAGASALVAKEIAGQSQETGLPVQVFTNDLAFMQPISFAKGLGEDEKALADYIVLSVTDKDVVIGISASGGTGFVFKTLELSQKKGAKTIAITENRDTPLGKVANIIIKSEAKPEGPSSSKIQAAHLVIGHALVLTIADERGIDAEMAVNYMSPSIIRNKKMGIK